MKLEFEEFMQLFVGVVVVLGALHTFLMKFIIEPTMTKTVTNAITSVVDRISKLELSHAKLETGLVMRSEEGDKTHDALWDAVNELRRYPNGSRR